MLNTQLFHPLRIGRYQLANRIIMAPLTRGRASEDGTPTPIMATYYAQRASAGLIISEATAVNARGRGWLNSPGIYSPAQVSQWREVASAVHAAGGKIFMQIWHMGALVHPDFAEGQPPLSASSVTLSGSIRTPSGTSKPFATAQTMTLDEIHAVEHDFVVAAKNAIDAGFDGVEIHAANGFLIDQFIRDGVNQRVDEYGGTTENRLRLLRNITSGICNAIGSDRVGVRLSPTNNVWGISDSDPLTTFSQAARYLNTQSLAYLHILEPAANSDHPMASEIAIADKLKELYSGAFIINGGLDQQTAEKHLIAGNADAAAFGIPFIANPDLVARFKQNAPLNTPDNTTFYTTGAKGYTDYPAFTTETAL